ncbi:DNA-3-methyladenine glycosylase [Clostridium manihotivorum]|uniref:Putative 3-methyladenine DNA glycosylase n=1 Tax=Clostridium manihotivorum TaxID=2320868 RepID=A0A410DNF7_9CLOT|nr:DNA-3-methyladenine glycosylase [Clostridium manihotivorum]QAA30621.1 DNA-3-methyladenine glycosylase [Clostridium manihotivorum]
MRIQKDFYARDAITVSRELLGKVLVRNINGITFKGKIVETEAYIGAIDKASHAYGGRMTERVKPLYGPPGIVYVFSIYGMYNCFNIITKEEGTAEGVLIRGIEPLEGLEEMAKRRFDKDIDTLTKTQRKSLTNGPSKLCIAFSIDKNDNWVDMTKSESIYLEEAKEAKVLSDEEIVETTRIGIDYAEEAVHFPWRFYLKGNDWVSKK